MDIIQEPDDRLHQVSVEVDIFDYKKMKEVAKIAKEMLSFCKGHKTSVGLAAPQIGILERFFVLYVGRVGSVHINPTIEPVEDDGVVTVGESCLSVNEGKGMTDKSRWRTLDITSCDIKGNKSVMRLTGFSAVAVQHEVDHLDGTTILTEEKGDD